jgi:hypothetical protein
VVITARQQETQVNVHPTTPTRNNLPRSYSPRELEEKKTKSNKCTHHATNSALYLLTKNNETKQPHQHAEYLRYPIRSDARRQEKEIKEWEENKEGNW